MGSETVSRLSVIGRVENIPDSGLLEVETQGRKLLLVRQGDAIHCIEAVCPHAGAPLAEGVLDGDVVICPWHKAAFAAGSGKCLEPPALADLAAYEVRVEGGDIILGEEKAAPTLPAAAQDERHFVILGGGAAGFSAAAELRAQNFAGRITLVDESAALPADRTALSKAVLAGAREIATTQLKPDNFYEAHDVVRQAGQVSALDAAAQKIGFSNGESLHYDAALIATGAVPKAIPFPGGELGNVFVLRSAADVERILAAVAGAKKIVVIGTSFIGMEVAASLRTRGLEVTVVGQEAAPFEATLGRQVGQVFQSLHEEHGVTFVLGVKIAKLVGSGTVNSVLLESGQTVPADIVIAGLGVEPATSFVKGLHLRDDGGIAVSETLLAAENLYAAGDVAAFPLHGAGARVRVEHWRVAEQQGRVAAQAMLGKRVAFDAVPYFWTMQFKARLDYVGHGEGSDEIVVRGDLGTRKFVAYYVSHGKVVAAAGMNENQNMAAVMRLLARKRWAVADIHPVGSSPLEVLQAS